MKFKASLGSAPKAASPAESFLRPPKRTRDQTPTGAEAGPASIQRQLKGTRDLGPYRCSFGPACIHNIQIYNILYNMCIYTPFYNTCIKKYVCFLKPALGHIYNLSLDLECRFHMIPYLNYGFSLFFQLLRPYP